MKVAVYRNLNRKGHVYSIMAREGALKGKVLGYAHGIILENCELRVSEAGRQRVLRNKRKNVHAFIVGDLVAATGYRTHTHNSQLKFEYCSEEKWPKLISKWLDKYPIGTTITYNPYKNASFVVKGTAKSINKANLVHFFHHRVEAHFAPRKTAASDKK